MKKKGKKNLQSKEIDQLSMLLNGRIVVLQEKVEGEVFTCRAAFNGISAALFGATGKGETKEMAQSMAKLNLAGVFAGSMLHVGLLKEFKASKGQRNGDLLNLCKPIFDNALSILNKAEYRQLLNSSRVFPPHSEEELLKARNARKEILAFARVVFHDFDSAAAERQQLQQRKMAAAPIGLSLLPPPPPPPKATKKRPSDKPSTSDGLRKKKRVVVEEEDDDCIVLDSSSESTDDTASADGESSATLGNTVQLKATEVDSGYDSCPPSNPYLEMAEKYSESDLLGVTAWTGARDERRRVEIHRAKTAYGIFTEFDNKVWQHYHANAQDDVIYNWKMQVRMNLLDLAKKVFVGCEVNMFAVGSTINGCGSYNSDMDLCLVLYNRDGSITEAPEFAKRNLNKVFIELKRNGKVTSKCQFIRHAVVPIIKLEIVSPNTLEVDINMNNIAGVYNSHLMHYYARVDDRFAALCLIVKHWAINAGVNDSLQGTFNSYSLILLVLHFLQCGVYPSILPNLQFLYPNRFGDRPELSDLNLFGEFTPPLPQRVLNEQSVGEVLIGFFQYYAQFDFRMNAISIRKGTTFPRSQLPSDASKFALYIEEPFDGKNTARCVRREYISTIREAFKHAASAFRDRPPSLEDINVHV